MSRLTFAVVAFTVVGALAAATVTDRGAFVMGFFVLLFGGVAAAVVLLSRGRWDADEPLAIDIKNPDPFIDELGVHHSAPVVISKGPGGAAQ